MTWSVLLCLLSACASTSGAASSRRRPRPASTAEDSGSTAILVSTARRPAAESTAEATLPRHKPLREFTDAERARIARVQPVVRAAARKHAVETHLINGIIWVESKFEPAARGRRGPRGLMQLMPRTARALARELKRRYKPQSAEFNVHVGTYYLARLLARFDHNVSLALAAYNLGPGAVRARLSAGEPMPQQITNYVGAVLRASAAFAQRER